MESPHVPGYQIGPVEDWIAENVPGLVPPLRWHKLEGGHSNLTYLLEDVRGKQAVIRRPPTGELLPGAHDMRREWTLISALNPTEVPVPPALGFCDDTTVTGAPFYLMGMVKGAPLYSSDDTERMLSLPMRERMAFSFVDVLADLHSIDPDDIGLGSFARKEGYIARQLKTWFRSWNASIEPAQFDDQRAHGLHDYFLAHAPEQGPARVVHGDYGLHNCLIGSDGTIAAVVDWEIATLGDPLADLAYALNQWAEPADPPSPRQARPTALPGFPLRVDLANRYAARTGRDLSGLNYYTGFNYWKSAAIAHGVYARYRQGIKSADGVDMDGLRASIDRWLSDSAQAVGYSD